MPSAAAGFFFLLVGTYHGGDAQRSHELMNFRRFLSNRKLVTKEDDTAARLGSDGDRRVASWTARGSDTNMIFI